MRSLTSEKVVIPDVDKVNSIYSATPQGTSDFLFAFNSSQTHSPIIFFLNNTMLSPFVLICPEEHGFFPVAITSIVQKHLYSLKISLSCQPITGRGNWRINHHGRVPTIVCQILILGVLIGQILL